MCKRPLFTLVNSRPTFVANLSAHELITHNVTQAAKRDVDQGHELRQLQQLPFVSYTVIQYVLQLIVFYNRCICVVKNQLINFIHTFSIAMVFLYVVLWFLLRYAD